MSGHADEEDDFFADIYGNDSHKGESQNPASKDGQEAASEKTAAPSTSEVSAESQNVTEPAVAPAAGENIPTAASGSASTASAPVAAPAAPAMPAPPADPRLAFLQAAGAPPAPNAAGGFDPAMFSQQLQQFQQMQQQMAQDHASDLVPAGQGGGFLAGKIFIPAKDEGKMFIGGLNWETTDESMRNYFSQFGEVTECMVMRDSMSGRSRGFGFLTFKDPKTVSTVLSKEHFLDGKIIDPKRAIPREEQDKTAKIFVGGVGADVTEEDFKSFFEQFGTVIDAQLMMDKDTGRPRGFGFVTFDSDQAVETIVAEQFLNLKGKPIEVKRAEPRGRDQARDDGRNGRAAFAMPQGNMYGNGMDPAMMTQYYQQWQAYMSKMQEMMQGGGGAVNPMMQMYQQMMIPGQGVPGAAPTPAQPQADDGDRDHRRDHRRRNDDRRRSRSPGANHRRRRDRDRGDRDRDRHYR